MPDMQSPELSTKPLHATQLRRALDKLEEIRKLKLEEIRKPTLTTREAAYFLNRAPATLHYWASKGEGLLRPVRIGKRLAWKTDEVRAILGVAA